MIKKLKSTFLVISAVLINGLACDKMVINNNTYFSKSLNGEWEFVVDHDVRLSITTLDQVENWRKIRVPSSWQTEFEDLRDYLGVAWYQKTINLPEIKPGNRMILEFKACDWRSVIFVNGSEVGMNEGGYLPFSFDITDYVRIGENRIAVRVMDPADTEVGTEGVSLWQVPHGKQSWYLQNSGIWQDVIIHEKPAVFAKYFRVRSDNSGKVTIEVDLAGNLKKAGPVQISYSILDKDKNRVLTDAWETDDDNVSKTHLIKDPTLWSPDSPYLYTAVVSIDGYRSEERFGFRDIKAEKGLILLNGDPVYFRGALDQDFYPDDSYRDGSGQYMRKGLLNAKAAGLNLVRYHMKIPPEEYLDLADEIGLMVWVDLPNWDVFSPEAGKRGERLFLNWINTTARNHPSLIAVSLINESWGVDLSQADQRAWLKSFYETAKSAAHDLLIVDNSACWGNFHIKTDLNDYHIYWSIPENRSRFTQAVRDIASRPPWLFSEGGDGEETGNEPLLVSEFGNWGLPRLPDEIPWWMEKQFQDIEISRPGSLYERFRDFEFDQIFNDYNELAGETQHAQFRALKWEIEELRSFPEIQGYVITEMTDINWEANGIQSIWRENKDYISSLAALQKDVIIIPRSESQTMKKNHAVEVQAIISNRSNMEIQESNLVWELGTQSNRIPVGPIKAGENTDPVSLSINLDQTIRHGNHRVNLTLLSKNNEQVAANYIEIFVLPDQEQPPGVTISGSNKFQESITKFYQTTGTKNMDNSQNATLVTDRFDDSLLEQVKKGGTVLVMVGDSTRFPDYFPIELESRNTEWYDGNWITNFNWVRNSVPPFNEMDMKAFPGFEIAGIMPEQAISNIPGEHFSDVLSGMFVGWIHLNSGYLVQAKVGEGRVLISTYDIASNLMTDPMAGYFYTNLLDYMGSEKFQPDFKILIK